MNCPKCGSPVGKNDEYCGSCGYHLNASGEEKPKKKFFEKFSKKKTEEEEDFLDDEPEEEPLKVASPKVTAKTAATKAPARQERVSRPAPSSKITPMRTSKRSAQTVNMEVCVINRLLWKKPERLRIHLLTILL